MTNFDRLTQLNSVEQFWEEIEKMKSHKLAPYIDFVAYLKSEDSVIAHFIKAIGECKLLPSEAEMVTNGCKTEADRETYRNLHQRSAYVLEEGMMLGNPYYTVTDTEGTILWQVPAKNVRRFVRYEDTEH